MSTYFPRKRKHALEECEVEWKKNMEKLSWSSVQRFPFGLQKNITFKCQRCGAMIEKTTCSRCKLKARDCKCSIMSPEILIKDCKYSCEYCGGNLSGKDTRPWLESVEMVSVENLLQMVDEVELYISKYKHYDGKLWTEDLSKMTKCYLKMWSTDRHFQVRKGLERVRNGYKRLVESVKRSSTLGKISSIVRKQYAQGDRSEFIMKIIEAINNQ